jgi:hypothetical protein
MARWADEEPESWQLALGLVAAWREISSDERRGAVAQRLAALASEGGPAAVERVVLNLADLAGMFIELYADCAGSSPEAILRDVAASGPASAGEMDVS